MKILLVTQYFVPEIGAAQTRLAAVCRELTRLGHEVEVVTALPNYPRGKILPKYRNAIYRRELWDGIPVHRVWLYASLGAGIKRFLNYLSFTCTCLFGLARASKPDYLFIESPPLSLCLPGILAARLWHVPAILNVADLWPDTAAELGLVTNRMILRIARSIEAWAYSRANAVNVQTEAIKRTLIEEKHVPRGKLLLLPNGVDTKMFAPGAPDLELVHRLGLEGKQIVLYAGTQGYAHGLEHVILAANLLKEDTDIHFVIVGDGSERATLETLKEKLVLRNITFVDPVREDELNAFYSIALCGIVSIRSTPTLLGVRPAKMFSLMASGVALLYIGPGEGASIVERASAGITVPAGSAAKIADALRLLINNPEKRRAFGLNGRCFVEKQMDWSKLVPAWVKQLTEESDDGSIDRQLDRSQIGIT